VSPAVGPQRPRPRARLRRSCCPREHGARFHAAEQAESRSTAEGRILIVDDESSIRLVCQLNLDAVGFQTLEAADGETALALARAEQPDLILLDVMMPELSGWEVCTTLKSAPETRPIPIAMLTVKSEIRDLITGMQVGADDYITKPFGTNELLARLRAVLRRTSEEDEEAAVSVGDVVVDMPARRVTRAGEDVHLTPIEFDLLRVLATHRGKLVTHRQLLHEVWGPGFESETHYLRVHVAHIRSKIEPDAARPRYVTTEPGVGYRLSDRVG
jgi:two-component system KDP operon response regulator KdpE